MKSKWSAAVAALLLVLGVLAVTPVADPARGLFAANADKVDGIHASKAPRPWTLVPLGRNAKFPASVVPRVVGPRGAAGATGPQGPKGDPGPSNAVETWFCTDELGCGDEPWSISASSSGEATPFVELDDLPAGEYAITGEVTVGAASGSDWRVQCSVVTSPTGDGTYFAGWAGATVGDVAGSIREASVPVTFGATLPGSGSIAALCYRTSGSGAAGVGPDPFVTYADLMAVRVASLQQDG